MREPESGDDSADPAMACIIALEEKRLGRFLNPREMDDLVRRFTVEDKNPQKKKNHKRRKSDAIDTRNLCKD